MPTHQWLRPKKDLKWDEGDELVTVLRVMPPNGLKPFADADRYLRGLKYLKLGAGWGKYTWKGMVVPWYRVTKEKSSFQQIR